MALATNTGVLEVGQFDSFEDVMHGELETEDDEEEGEILFAMECVLHHACLRNLYARVFPPRGTSTESKSLPSILLCFSPFTRVLLFHVHYFSLVL